MEQSNQFLGTEPIGALMKKYAVPCIISLLVGALYNIVDQIFIANASYLGSYGNAANTVVFPLTVVALAIAVMVGDGCCAFVSISLGKGETGHAKKSVGNSVMMIVGGSLLLTAVYLLFQTQIIGMFGGTVNEETFHYSKEYFFYISLGIPFYMFGQAMNPIIRADGNPRFAMVSTLVGAVANIILDPIFIFIFRWGMMGAAVATVAGQVMTAALAGWYLCHMKTIKPSANDLKLNRRICGRTLLLGITSFLSQISLVGAIAFVLLEVFPKQLISIFGAANESSYYTTFAMKAFRVYLCMVILACVNKACFIFLQAMGKAAASTALSMIREVVFGVGFALVLPLFWGLDGVLYSMPVSDVLTFIVAAFLIVRTYQELKRS